MYETDELGLRTESQFLKYCPLLVREGEMAWEAFQPVLAGVLAATRALRGVAGGRWTAAPGPPLCPRHIAENSRPTRPTTGPSQPSLPGPRTPQPYKPGFCPPPQGSPYLPRPAPTPMRALQFSLNLTSLSTKSLLGHPGPHGTPPPAFVTIFKT